MASSVDDAVGRNVRARRLALGLSVEQLARLSRLSAAALTLGEAGLRRFTALDLMHLTCALDTAPAELMAIAAVSGTLSAKAG